MKKRKVDLFLFIGLFVIILLNINFIIAADCFDSSISPIPICSCSDLQRMNEQLLGNYTLMNDIDCTDTKNWNGGKGFIPIGTNPADETKIDWTKVFSGNLYGNGKIIKNLYINRPNAFCAGLFCNIYNAYYYTPTGKTASVGNISRLGLDNVDITGGGNVGALVGDMRITGNIDQVYATGKVRNTFTGKFGSYGACSSGFFDSGSEGFYAGGLIGFVGGNSAYVVPPTISNSYAKVDVTSAGWSGGGFIGLYIWEVYLINSYSTGKVSAAKDPSGFVGKQCKGIGWTKNCFWDKESSGISKTSGEAIGKTTADMKTATTYTGWDFINTCIIDEGKDYPRLRWENFCTPSCSGKKCGDSNGCGGFCDGSCNDDNACTIDSCTKTSSGCSYVSKSCDNDKNCDINGNCLSSSSYGCEKNTIGLYDPVNSYFNLRNTNSFGFADIGFGYGGAGAGWIPIAGDWNNDGKDTVGLYDPVNSYFNLRNTNTGGSADIGFGFGTPNAGWKPFAGDWNNDGIDTVGLYDPVNSIFYLKNSNTGGNADISFGFGGAGWIPIAGDWNNDGKDTIGLYNPVNSEFNLRNDDCPTQPCYAEIWVDFGIDNSGWLPIAGDWNNDGIDTVGLYNPLTSSFYLKNSNINGAANITFGYGAANAGWIPIAGDWDKNCISCIPKTCVQLGKQCGSWDNLCGAQLDCGTCAIGKFCNTGLCQDSPCVPKTCSELGKQCGTADAGCGISLNCGICNPGESCINGLCQLVNPICIPQCINEDMTARECGGDGCGGVCGIGTCPTGKTCNSKGKCIDPLKCFGVLYCSNYTDSVKCQEDECGAGISLTCGTNKDQGEGCNVYIPETSCGCEWKNGKCNQRTTPFISFQGSQVTSECLQYVSSVGECNEDETRIINLNGTLSWNTNDFTSIISKLNSANKKYNNTPISNGNVKDWLVKNCNIDTSYCYTGEREVLCGENTIRLNFFSLNNLLVTVALIIIIYSLWFFSRKKVKRRG